jgi:hypothetical protein
MHTHAQNQSLSLSLSLSLSPLFDFVLTTIDGRESSHNSSAH